MKKNAINSLFSNASKFNYTATANPFGKREVGLTLDVVIGDESWTLGNNCSLVILHQNLHHCLHQLFIETQPGSDITHRK